MKKTDLILVVIALAAAAGIWLFYSAGAEKGGTAIVTVDGVEKAALPLNGEDSVRIETETGYNVVTVQDGQAFVTEADCRDQICPVGRRLCRHHRCGAEHQQRQGGEREAMQFVL